MRDTIPYEIGDMKSLVIRKDQITDKKNENEKINNSENSSDEDNLSMHESSDDDNSSSKTGGKKCRDRNQQLKRSNYKLKQDEESDKYVGRNEKRNINKYSKNECFFCCFDLAKKVKINETSYKKVQTYPYIPTRSMRMVAKKIEEGLSCSTLDKGCISAEDYYTTNIKSLYDRQLKNGEEMLPDVSAIQIKYHFTNHSPTRKISLYLSKVRTESIIEHIYENRLFETDENGEVEINEKNARNLERFMNLHLKYDDRLYSNNINKSKN